jgi:SAM-dependent methyltransferase
MDGWETLVSKTHGKTYYFHKTSGRRQWTKPDEQIEKDKQLIKSYYSTTNLSSEYDFLTCIKASIFYEFSLDLQLSDWTKDNEFSVLDVGCGYSNDSELWSKLGGTYKGLDDNTTQKNVLKSDFTAELTWQKEKYDVITCIYSIEFACSDKHSFQTLLNGMIKSLTDNGRIIIITPDKGQWRNGGIFKTDGEEKLWGDRFTCSLTDELPMWWFDEKMLEDLKLHVFPSCNLAKFAAWVGFDSPKISLQRAFEYKFYHYKCRELYRAPFVSAEDWRCANFFKVVVLTKTSKCGVNYLKEINTF